MADPNSILLSRIKSRAAKQSEFNSGILTADRYVKTLSECVGSDLCYRYGSTKSVSFHDVEKRAAETLTYNNPEMVVADVYSDAKSTFAEEHEIELPKNTLMVFRHVLTTSKKDRDGDVLRTEGARLDPKMLLLWQHVHTLPIGKMLKTVVHDSKKLEVISAIVDINELAHDAAVMIDNDMGKFSHGFRALSFEDYKEPVGSTTGPSGFLVKEFEIMEESLVSVPANPDADQQEILLDLIEGDKLSSSMMKSFGRMLRSKSTSTKSVGGFDAEQLKAGKCGCGQKDTGTGDGSSEEGSKSPTETESSEDEKGMTCSECKTEKVDGECPKCAKKEADPSIVITKDAEGQIKRYRGNLSGTWEFHQEKLRDSAYTYLEEKGLVPQTEGESEWRGWAYPVGTTSSSCVVCLETRDSELYFQIEWEKDENGMAKFIGQPKEVIIQVSTTLIEKTKRLAKLEMKSGKKLSATTVSAIKAIESALIEIEEHCSTQTGKKLCKKASGAVKTLINQAEADPVDSEKEPDVILPAEAAAVFLSKSTEDERKRFLAVLTSVCSVDDQKKFTSSLRQAVRQ